MCDLIKTNIGDKQCLSRLLTCGRCLQTSLFWGRPLELDGFTLSARIRASDSSRMIGAKIYDSYVVFHSDESDDGIRSKH